MDRTWPRYVSNFIIPNYPLLLCITMLYSGDHLMPLSCQYWYDEEKMYQPIKCTNRWKLHYMIEYWYFHLMNTV